jgi:hypothetical protein
MQGNTPLSSTRALNLALAGTSTFRISRGSATRVTGTMSQSQQLLAHCSIFFAESELKAAIGIISPYVDRCVERAQASNSIRVHVHNLGGPQRDGHSLFCTGLTPSTFSLLNGLNTHPVVFLFFASYLLLHMRPQRSFSPAPFARSFNAR